jgi:hypothetical protein
MTTSLTYKCPNCGAPVKYDGGDELAVPCSYCGTSAPVPEELRPHKAQIEINVVDASPGPAPSRRGAASAGGCLAAIVIVPIIIVAAAILIITNIVNQAIAPVMLSARDIAATKESLVSTVMPPTRAPARTPTPAASPTPGMASVVLSFGEEGSGQGQFKDARNIAVDGAGNVYVGDYTGGRIQVFDSNGKFLRQWFAGNAKMILLGMAAGPTGTVYVADGAVITRYDGATGKSLGKLPYQPGRGFGELAIAPDGGLAAMWYQRRNGVFTSLDGAREDLVRYDNTGKVTNVIEGVISSQTENLELNNCPAVGPNNDLFVLAQAEQTLFQFTRAGDFVTRLGSHGDAPDQLNHASALAIDSQGRLFVADGRNIKVFASNGRYVDTIRLDASPDGLAFDSHGNLYAVARDRVLKLVFSHK